MIKVRDVTNSFAILSAIILLMHNLVFNFTIGNTYYLLFLLILIPLLFGKNPSINISMTFLVTGCLLSLVFNEIPSFFQPYERFGIFLLLLLLIGPFYSNSLLVEYRNRLFWILNYLITLLVALSFVGLTLNLSIVHNFSGFSGFFSHSMFLGPMAAVSSIFCFYVYYISSTKKKKFFYIILFAISLLACLASGSRAALFAGLSGLIFSIYFLYKGRFIKYLKVIFISILVLTLSFPVWKDYSERIIEKVSYAEEQGSLTTTRDVLWQSRLLEFDSSPIVGVGFSAMDTNLNNKYDKETGNVEPGSSWLAVLSMTGLLGFIPLIVLLFSVLNRILRQQINLPFSALLGGILIFFIIHMFAEGYIFSAGSGLFFYFWLLMGVIINEQESSCNISYKYT